MSAPHYTDIETYISVVDDHIVIALLIILIPYAIFYEIWSRKVLGIQALVPDFLERMAGINQVGLTIAQAIAIMVNTNLGLLSYEIRRIKRDMEWGANFTEALMRFEERVSTPSIARTVTLITKASEMSGQIGEVLSIASSDAKMTEILKKERLAEMFIYTAIVYLSFFVFLFVVGVLTTQFLPVLGNISTKGLPVSGALSGIGSIPIITFNRSAVPCVPCPGDLLRAYCRADGGVLSCSGGKALLRPPDHRPDSLQLCPRCPTRLMR